MRSISEMSDLNGKVALLSGGAGHIGRAMAAALVESGCAVILIDRNESSLKNALKELDQIRSGHSKIIVCDLSNIEKLDLLRKQVDSEFGQLDILINNAAFVGDSKLDGWCVDFEKQTIPTWSKALDLNLTVPFVLTQAFTKLLAKDNKGSVINVGSIYGLVGPDMSLYEGTSMGNPAAYAASKGGLIQLTRWLATNLSPSIRVNTITPGGVYRGQPNSFVDKFISRTPMGRMAIEEDFKGATIFLASDLSSYITGQNIVVDGGWTAW
jgi:NAD(P)-dependent dehydrogenase (short-subunit alcohol dehydrogenase family)